MWCFIGVVKNFNYVPDQNVTNQLQTCFCIQETVGHRPSVESQDESRVMSHLSVVNLTKVTTNDFKHNCINLSRLRQTTGTF